MDQANGREPAIIVVDSRSTERTCFDAALGKLPRRVDCYFAATAEEARVSAERLRDHGDLRLVVQVLSAPSDALDLVKDLRHPSSRIRVPVVVFGSSFDSAVVDDLERAGANSFVIREPNDSSFVEQIQKIVGYWIRLNLVPAKNR